MRFFTTEGPVDCARHYCLPPLSRFDLEELLLLIEQQKYFLLHAPRQTGKTSCLRQLRAGYPKRPTRFPQTAILCGVRDLQDYRIHSSGSAAAITGGSAFNIKAKSLRLGDFSQADTAWEQKVWQRSQVHEGRAIGVWGL